MDMMDKMGQRDGLKAIGMVAGRLFFHRCRKGTNARKFDLRFFL